jgi:hypothetical protein
VFDPGLERKVRAGFLFSRYGYFSRDPLQIPLRIQRKNNRREKSRAGMERTYSG